jgi:hypothetical protein
MTRPYRVEVVAPVLITTSLLVVSVPDTVALPVKLGDAIGAKSVLMLVLLIANASSVDAVAVRSPAAL